MPLTARINSRATKSTLNRLIGYPLAKYIFALVFLLLIDTAHKAMTSYWKRDLSKATVSIERLTYRRNGTDPYFKPSSIESKRPPNIVFMVVDDMGFNDWEWRNPLLRTPFMKSLAEKGVVFDRYYTHQVCAPSRAALLSGRYIIRTGWNNLGYGYARRAGLREEYSLLQEELNLLGYTSHMVGKWHVGWCRDSYLPHRRGFSTFLGIHHRAANHYNYTIDVIPGKPDVRPYCLFKASAEWGQEEYLEGDGTYSTDLYRDKALGVISRHDFTDSRLFLYVAFQAIHAPLQAPESLINSYANTHKRLSRRKVAAMLEVVDQGVKSIVKALKQRKVLKNSIIVLVSDNGGNPFMNGGSNYPLRGGKQSSWEGGIRVPALMYSPLFPEEIVGQVNKCLFHVTDWYTTLLTLAGADTSWLSREGVDGINQWEAIETRGEKCPRTSVVHDVVVRGNASSLDDVYSATVLKERHKLIWGYTGRAEMNNWYFENGTKVRAGPQTSMMLFDVHQDPEERHDLLEEDVANATHYKLARSMVEMVQRELRRGGDIIKYRYDVPEERDLGLDDMISSDKKHWKFGGCEAKKKKL